ncbi:unnamed protein product [Rotaria sp. Silwood1]|nr:unnamed protein product [Rotaria sp. Silwood1]CAF4931836.1 unnamed protein product [Rotaria sp. Silwood1]
MTTQVKELIETKSITVLDDLSSELILCIFEYLSAVDRYKSFFGCNTRLGHLVKRWTSYSRKQLDADIERFSTLHSWYKHLAFKDGGTEFIIFPQKGEQPRNSIDPSITDTAGLHWFFLRICDQSIITDERIRKILVRHSFQLNPFFYHDEMNCWSNSKLNGKRTLRTFYGGHIIIMDRNQKDFESWIRSNYPEHADRILGNSSYSHHNIDEACAPIFESEWLKAVQVIRDSARQVWEELKQLEDVNPFEIRKVHY